MVEYANKLTIGALLAEAKRLYFDNKEAYLKLFLVFLLPLILLPLITPLLPWWLSLLLYVLAIVFYLTGFIAVVWQTGEYLSGATSFDLKAAFNKANSYFLRYLFTALLMIVLVFLLSLLFIIPGIIFSIYWFFSFIVVILKDKKGMKALQYSKQLVKGRWWSVLGYLFVFSLFSLALSLPFILLLLLFGQFHSAALNTIANIIFSAGVYLIAIYFVIVEVVFFKNLDVLYREKETAKQEQTS